MLRVTVIGLSLVACGLCVPACVRKAPPDDTASAKSAQAYMSAIERRARSRHVKVIWVRPPDQEGTPPKAREELRRIVATQPPLPY